MEKWGVQRSRLFHLWHPFLLPSFIPSFLEFSSTPTDAYYRTRQGQKTSQDHLRSTPINHTSHNSRSIFQQLRPGINTALPLNLVERATCPPEHMQSSDCRLGRPRTLAVLVVPSGDGGSCSAGTHLTPQHTSWVWVKNGNPFRPKRKFLKPLGYNHSLSFNPGEIDS